MTQPPAPVVGKARRRLMSAIVAAVLSVAAALVAVLTPGGSPAGVAFVVAAAEDSIPPGAAPGADPPAAARTTALEETALVLRKRLRELGVRPLVDTSEAASGTVTIWLRGVGDTERLKTVLFSPKRFEMKLVVGGPAFNRADLLPASQVVPLGNVVASSQGLDSSGPLPLGKASTQGPDSFGRMWYLLEDLPVLSGRDVKAARQIVDELNEPAISFSMTDDGARKFHAFTTTHVGKPVAILLGDQVVSAPVIEAPIAGTEGRITGHFTREEAADIALVLNAGALPVPLRVIEQRALAPIPGRPAVVIAALVSAVVLGATTIVLFAVFLVRS